VETGKVPEISIYAERRGESVRLWFQDNGIGIAEEAVPHFSTRLREISGHRSRPGTGEKSG
jgi:signal transduction histidine kinase